MKFYNIDVNNTRYMTSYNFYSNLKNYKGCGFLDNSCTNDKMSIRTKNYSCDMCIIEKRTKKFHFLLNLGVIRK